MASNKSLLVLAALFAALLFISSEVSARDLAEQTHEKNAKEADAGSRIEDQKGLSGYNHVGYPQYIRRCPPQCPGRCCCSYYRYRYNCRCCLEADKIPEPENRPKTEPNN